MKKSAVVKFLVSTIVIGGALIYLVFNAMSSSWAYDISVDDFLGNSEVQSYVARVAGTVEEGTLKKDVKAMRYDFKLTGGDISMDVYYEGIMPENFEEGRDILVEGRLEDKGLFKADKIITKCESKYEAKLKEE